MSRLDELIAELCPSGVPFAEVGTLCKVLSPKAKIKSKDYLLEGKYPVVDQGQEFIGGYTNETDVFPNNRYIIFGDHTCIVKYVDFAFAQGADGVKVLSANETSVMPKYLYYCISSIRMDSSYARHWAKIRKHFVPVPPIEVQREIVRILDNFTELTAELTAELNYRKKQYQYYLDKFFEGQTDCLVSLKEVGTLTRGKRFVHADAVEEGVPCIHYGELYTYYGTHTNKVKSHIREELRGKMRYAHKGDVIIVGAGENDIDIGVGVSWEGDKDVAVHDACYTLTHTQNSRYISHFLRSHMYHEQIKKYVSSGKICAISADGLGRALIPIPSLEKQKTIVSVLDRFDSLCNDISAGLPAEIEARTKQYEYYRDKLLTFKEKKA